MYGLRAGVLAAMGFAAADLGLSWWLEGRLQRLTIFTAALIAVMGGLSLWSEDPRFFLMSPAIGDIIFAALLIASSLFGDGLLIAALEEQDPEIDLHPMERAFFRSVGLRFAAGLLLHALWVNWAAQIDKDTWMWVATPGQYLIIGVQMVGEVLWARLVLGPRIDAVEGEP